MSAMNLALKQVVEGHDLTTEETQSAISELMDGNAEPLVTAATLTALRMKGESVEELVGAARAMRERAAAIPTTSTGMIDTCGTGGDRLSTFNISTATALVVAAAGIPVAKHGNRSVSSKSGSADVLEALGVRIDLTTDEVGKCIDEVGIGFCFAPLIHGAMKHAVPIRKTLGIRTIFNFLGPLTNPAGAEYQLIGGNRTAVAEKLASALAQLGITRAVVVCGNDELDEVALWGETTAFIVEDGSVEKQTWTASDFGLPTCSADDLRVGDPTESAAVIRRIIEGEEGACANIVLANAASALLAAGKVSQLSEGVEKCRELIQNGAVSELLERLVRQTTSRGENE
ncbi:anthranilate phosphoribosyltransferase [Calycomorphotria hydatis]|uniref:Anthranilate phosphoribosyltransferase n=1 Tax=Calycomorphotria hydatis TaxID=2528027 RepID=A0A517T7Z0_9PLAN|nr:anthranilate phosphoribosyltransferase [Calycomorphotria hydatis]QDT64493.1 Anthranilate phosphoribosyltransferase [Calycomorphotria hydatis]